MNGRFVLGVHATPATGNLGPTLGDTIAGFPMWLLRRSIVGKTPGTVTLTVGRPKRSDFAERRCQAIALALVTSRQPAKAVSRAARRSTAVVDSG
jgi:hypothetical protein